MKEKIIMDKKVLTEEILSRGVEEVIVQKSLSEKLISGKKLRIKFGVDPTSPKIHLGHSVVLRKLKAFQNLGHQVIFLIGDFTAQIGDPSDRLSARQPLTKEQITENMKLYKEQVGKILDLKKVEIRHNSEWHGNMDFAELFSVASRFTVNQMLERDMFKKRIQLRKPLWVHEMMYPILQAYDSVALRADVELGGTDQTFNMLAARTLQPHYDQPPQDIMTVQLLEGTDGQKKMSKSTGNTIDLSDSPQNMFGKVMSIPDGLIIKFFTLLTDLSLKKIVEFDQAIKKGANPRDYKFLLAKELVAMYHGDKNAQAEAAEFDQVFKNKKAPSSIPEFKATKSQYAIIELITEANLAKSKGEARRLVTQGGVRYDQKLVKDWQAVIKAGAGKVLQVGKRKFIKLVK
ncbi:MAG: tyrosine--tRNA ligase [Patescibacteria group bacterium]|jgi:tyrosyl-tRNA synthetase